MGRGRRSTRTREAAASHCACACIIHVCLDKPEKKAMCVTRGRGLPCFFFRRRRRLLSFIVLPFLLHVLRWVFSIFLWLLMPFSASAGLLFLGFSAPLCRCLFSLYRSHAFFLFLFLFPLFFIHVHTHQHHPPLPLPCCPLFYVVALFEDEEIQERGGGGVHVIEEQEAIWSRLEGG